MSKRELAAVTEIEAKGEKLEVLEVVRRFNYKWRRRYQTDNPPLHVVVHFHTVMRYLSEKGLLVY